MKAILRIDKTQHYCACSDAVEEVLYKESKKRDLDPLKYVDDMLEQAGRGTGASITNIWWLKVLLNVLSTYRILFTIDFLELYIEEVAEKTTTKKIIKEETFPRLMEVHTDIWGPNVWEKAIILFKAPDGKAIGTCLEFSKNVKKEDLQSKEFLNSICFMDTYAYNKCRELDSKIKYSKKEIAEMLNINEERLEII